MIDILKIHECEWDDYGRETFEIYEVYDKSRDHESLKIKDNKDLTGYEIFMINADYCSTKDLETFIELYNRFIKTIHFRYSYF